MLPTKEGQIVKFHTPLEDENPDVRFVILEIHFDVERPRAKIQALNTGMAFSPISMVSVDELEVVQVDTADLTGHQVIITKSDSSQVQGIVVSVSEKKIYLDLTRGVKGVETNVYLTVVDDEGTEHCGTLYVTP